MPIARCLLLAALAVVVVPGARAQPSCPVEAGAASTLLVVQSPDGTRVGFDEGRLAAMPAQQRVQLRSVSAGASAAGVEQSLRYGGVLLRDVLEGAMPEALKARGARHLVFEAIATDRYVAVFTWGELFNTDAGSQVLIVRTQNDERLGADAGPLALRALADLRPGPRHVRNLCAIVARTAPGP